jgi:GTP:adenosylcobinamide-phosphate guanylyltransferase
LSRGLTCPRKALSNMKTHILTAPNPQKLLNVNTPEDVEKMKLDFTK